ncbi:M20/M25/M40 family metallo-hydrolase [Allonocardiopsis opalescens]|uniref:Acetylornithine deacetylase n=1 Tax=Allonocardiopsis opalescens TaxID=1144618 RepID=A0A2T0PYA8_9ACTN|nr:M20/M25/M40 family metallo-hydrolase [Allonocardiopsis opalescens]PRX96504.1 acetylornithine deacetylase [Allonocardiopsis opalescens]
MNDPADDGYAVALLKSMLDTPSPSYQEGELAADLMVQMRAMGYTAHLDKAGNVVGVLDRGRGPTVMMLGHIDTVPGSVPVRFEEGRLYGRGAVDAKGPMAAMVCAGARATGFCGRVVVVGAVEEETPGSRGAVHIRKNHPPPDALIVGEPSGWSAVVLGYKGKLDLHYRVERPATHPSSPWPKAVELAAEVWRALLTHLGPDTSHTRFDRPGVTLVSLMGDLTRASAEFSVRTPPGFDGDACLDALRRATPEGELLVRNAVAACRVGRSDPVVRALSAAIRDQGARPTAKVKTATSDMNTLAEEWRIPMATYGPGDSTLCHHDDEHIELADYLAAVRVLTGALTALPAAESTAS